MIDPRTSRFDVAVIGGGVAGIACAAELAEADQRVALIEQRPTLGGRVHSHRDSMTGDMIDNGPHLMVGGYFATRSLLRRLGTSSLVRFQPRLEIAMCDEDGETVFRHRRLPRELGLAAGLAGMRGISWRDVWRTRDLLRSARDESREKLDAMSCEVWFDRLGIPESVRRLFLNPICLSALNDVPARASAALFANVLARTFSDRGTDGLGFITVPQTDLFEGAIQNLVEQAGGEVMLGKRAKQVLFHGERAVWVQFADGREITAQHVVVAVPHRAVPDLFDEQHRGALDSGILESLGSAPIVNIHLWLNRPVLERPLLGLIGRPTQFVLGLDHIWTEPSRHHRVIGIISGPTGHAEKSHAELIDQMMEDLRACLPEAWGAEVVRSLVVKERAATFLPCPGLLMRRPGTRSPWPNVWWAGDWTASGFPATIEGAALSGSEAARAILSVTH
ncbi:FAD-dependent oxidoreductase [Candidatus Sumerlaeota bacterium]|nr:FAD-dependent oxidoreductase [Candidatus Sumerlaeota bacterium]